MSGRLEVGFRVGVWVSGFVLGRLADDIAEDVQPDSEPDEQWPGQSEQPQEFEHIGERGSSVLNVWRGLAVAVRETVLDSLCGQIPQKQVPSRVAAYKTMALGTDDHQVTLAVGTVVVVFSFVVLSVPWYYALIAGMLVSGFTEFVIKEVPPDTDEYDPEQYRLWAAADDSEPETEETDPIEKLREQYARGELDEEEFERRVEEQLATETADADDQTDRDVLTER